MKLVNEFEVAAPLTAAWPVIIDVPRVARCLPGAMVESSEGDTHRGRMTAKIGPISATYAGSAIVQETDEDNHTVVMALEARESRGQGMASATITNRLAPRGDRTRVIVETELRMTGAQAQFGRGILQSVAGSLTKQFAANLEAEIHGDGERTTRTAPGSVTGAATGSAKAATPATPALDVASLLPALATPKAALSGLGVVGLLLLLLRRRPARSAEIHVYLHLPGEPR